VVARDVREQLQPWSFHLVGAGRVQRRLAHLIEVALDGLRLEWPHGQAGPLHVVPQPGAIAHHDDRRDQLVGRAGEHRDLRMRVGAINRLVEPATSSRQDLVGADDQRARVARGDAARFQFGQGLGGTAGVDLFGAQGLLDLGFVDGRDIDAEDQPDRSQQRRARGAGRGENEGRRHGHGTASSRS